MTSPKFKAVKVWIYSGHLTKKGRDASHESLVMCYGEDPYYSAIVCFKKPINPQYVPVLITPLPPRKNKSKTNG